MKEYIITLVGTALFCGFITILSPDGEGEGLKKHIKLIASLCVLCVLIAPLTAFAEGLEDYEGESLSDIFEREEYINKYEEICNESISSYTSEEIARRCEEIICEELDMKRDSFEVAVESGYNGEEITVLSATVTLYPEAITQNPHEISELLENLLDCKCEIIYK
ncbi:MAG: stage III sporulation protein AF [Clostridia bacterium]|nr:stage III sporulation protein AF [Clostridia bacterium]